MKRTSILIFFIFLGCVKTEIERTKKLPINFIGDSLTEGYGDSLTDYSYPGQIRRILTNRTVNNIGIGGQAAEQIVARQGGLPIYLTISGNSFIGTNEIPVDSLQSNVGGKYITNLLLSTNANATEKTISGKINGIKCLLIRRVRKPILPFIELYTLKPLESSNSTIPPNSRFYPDEGYSQDSCVNVIWVGRNNGLETSQARNTVLEIINQAVLFNKAKKFIILGMLKNVNSYPGSSTQLFDDQMSDLIRNTYPQNYVELSPPTENEMKEINYIPSARDKIDIANGVFPLGMRYDALHLITPGNSIIANRVYKKLKELNY